MHLAVKTVRHSLNPTYKHNLKYDSENFLFLSNYMQNKKELKMGNWLAWTPQSFHLNCILCKYKKTFSIENLCNGMDSYHLYTADTADTMRWKYQLPLYLDLVQYFQMKNKKKDQKRVVFRCGNTFQGNGFIEISI